MVDNIRVIQYMRGTAAMLVVFYHFIGGLFIGDTDGAPLFKSGSFGVDLFFVISGFVICLSTQEKNKHHIGKYIIRRVFRIYPLLIVSVIVYFFVTLQSHDYFSLLRAIVPLHQDYSAGAPFYMWNMLGPAWTLTYEIVFYAIFLVSMSVSFKNKEVTSILFILALVIFIQLACSSEVNFNAYNKLSLMPGTILHAPITLMSSPIFIDFTFGVAAFILHKKYTPPSSEKVKTLVSLLCILCVLLSLYLIFSNTVYGHGPLRWGSLCFLIVLALLMLEKNMKIPDVKILNFLGAISYSVYMVHVIILEQYKKMASSFKLYQDAHGIPLLVTMVIVALIVSTIVHYAIELPAIRAGKRLCNRL